MVECPLALTREIILVSCLLGDHYSPSEYKTTAAVVMNSFSDVMSDLMYVHASSWNTVTIAWSSNPRLLFVAYSASLSLFFFCYCRSWTPILIHFCDRTIASTETCNMYTLQSDYNSYGVSDHYQPSILLASVLQTIQRYDALLVYVLSWDSARIQMK